MSDRLIVAFALVLFLVSPLLGDEIDEPLSAWQQRGWPLMQQFCLDCHNADTQEGELDLSGFERLGDSESVGATMQRVLEMVRFGAMPPEDAELPSATERKELAAALDEALYAVSCDLRPRPGKVTARRLNRTEYNNSIRDLFGIDLRPADQFPSDEVGAGFDNNADVLSLSPMLIEKYLSAAEQVSQAVLIDPSTLPRISKEIPGDQLLVEGPTKTGRFNGRFLAPESYACVEFEVPASGEYRIRVRGGNARKETKPTMVAIFDKDGLLQAKDDLKFYGGGGSSDGCSETIRLEKGKHRLFLEPIEDPKRKLEIKETRSEQFASLDEKMISAARQRRKPLRPDDDLNTAEYPFMFRNVSIEGPQKHDAESYPPSQFQILRRTARRDRRGWHDVEPAAAECLKPLMRRAFREPVTDEEVRPYARLVADATKHGDSYYRGLQIAISAVLVSPRFLFRVETPPADWKPEQDGDDVVPLTQHQLATRLSYFLWSSLPDESLLADADKNRLDESKIRYHVQRMIGDQKSESLATEFAAQWFGLGNLAVHEADTDHFQRFDPDTKEAMRRETEELFLHILHENKPVAELLTADYTFLNTALAKHYGVAHQSEGFERVSLKSTNRRGILSHAGILTMTSNPNRTSPVKRGKWILENVLGTPPPEPPPGVPPLEETETADKNASLRDQLELHRKNPTCASCHRVMDQLGFGLEHFDAIGQLRETESGKPIDASGELPGGRKFNGASQLSKILADSEREAFARTAVKRLLTFGIGRELTPADRCTVDEMMEATGTQDYRMADLILAVVQSRPFQYYQWTKPD